MQEIITVSVSHRANHLTTQFFNCQEQNLFNADPKNSLDSTTFLHSSIDKISKTASYYPRLLLWESRNGNGSLGTYQYVPETQDYHFQSELGSSKNDFNKHKLVTTHQQIPRSKYQLALDNNETLPELNKDNTLYWSDYNKLIYKPHTFNYLTNWYHDPQEPNLPDYQNLKSKRFTDINQGSQEWDLHKDTFMDESLRTALEQCDSLQGFNLVTDMDSAWSGFTMSLLEELRDELPKSSIFLWGFYEPDFFTDVKNMNSTFQMKNIIRSSLALINESDLVFPIYSDPTLTNWEFAGQTCKLYDAVNSVISQRDPNKKKSMSYLTNCITEGESKKNFISSMIDTNSSHEYGYCSYISKYDKKASVSNSHHEFSYCMINRGPPANKDPKEINEPNKKRSFRELETTTYYPSDTIPEQYRNEQNYSMKLSSTEKCRDLFKHWHLYVSKYFRSDDDREELKEDIGTLISTYEHGWYSDEDSEDDI